MFVSCRSAKLGISPIISDTYTSHPFPLPLLSLETLGVQPAWKPNVLSTFLIMRQFRGVDQKTSLRRNLRTLHCVLLFVKEL